jgi:hypothetical protein
LAAAISGKNTTFVNPVTMSGQKIGGSRLKEYLAEFEKLRKICKQPGKTSFRSIPTPSMPPAAETDG